MDAVPASDPTAVDVDAVPPKVRTTLSHRTLRGGAWTLASRIGSMGSLFLLTVVLARSMPKSESAAFMTATSAVPFLAMLATMGVPLTLVRVLRAEVDSAHQRRMALVGALKLSAAGCVLSMVGYLLVTSQFPDDPKWLVLREMPWAVCAWFAMAALAMIAATYLQAEEHFRTAALVGARSGGLIPNGLALVAAVTLSLGGWLTLGRVLTVQVAAYIAALAVAAWIIGRTLQRGPAEPSAPSGGGQPAEHYGARWYFAESWPNLINQLINVLLAEGDLFWIAMWVNDAAVADYGVIRGLRLLVTAPLMVAAIALPPFVAELHGRGDLKRLERLVRGVATMVAAPSLIALVALMLAPTIMLRLVAGEAFVGAAPALQILCVGGIIFVLTGNNGLTLVMTGRQRELMVWSLASLAFYAVISPPLASRYGIVGAATAFTLQTIVQNVSVTLRVKQIMGIWTVPLTSWAATREEAVQLMKRLRRRP
jgi:O-antigen/teichoic acid export membrane protein